MKLLNGDCLELMKDIPSGSVDLVLTDPPYGTTACKWDTVIPFEPMWEQLNRIIKPNGAICLFGREPFTSCLIMSNIKDYKHKWVWNKKQSGSPFNAKYMPLQIEEDIICFCKGNKKVNYYPQMRKGKMRTKGGAKTAIKTMGGIKRGYKVENDLYFPINILEFANCRNRKSNVHPTQKPIDLLEYLIKTYTNEDETVLDFTMGSGSCGVACINTNRDFIGIELDQNYFNIAKKRIEEAKECLTQKL